MTAEVRRVYLVLALLNTGDGLVNTLASAYLRSLGYPLGQIGILVSIYAVAALFSRWPAGRIADGGRAHIGLRVACGVFAASLALYPVALEPWAFWTVRMLHGASFGVATTLNFAAFLTVSASTNRARATALYTTAMSGGYSLGNFASGFVADNLGFTAAFTLAAVFPLAAMVAAPGVATAPRPASAEPVGAWWRLLGRRTVRIVPIVSFCSTFLNQVLATLFPIYVLQVGLTLSVAGVARGLQSLSNTAIRPFGGPLLRRAGPLTLGCGGILLSAAAIAAVPLLTLPFALFGLFIIVGAGRAGGVLSSALSTASLSDAGVLRRGTASALMSAGGDLGSISAPIVSGAVAAQLGIGTALQVVPVGVALLGVALVLIGPRARIRDRDSERGEPSLQGEAP